MVGIEFQIRRSSLLKRQGAAHKGYKTVVGQYNKHGFNKKVNRIIKNRLNRTANGLADLMYMIKKNSKKPKSPPSTSPTSEGDYFGDKATLLLHNPVQGPCDENLCGLSQDIVYFNSVEKGTAAGYERCSDTCFSGGTMRVDVTVVIQSYGALCSEQ